MVIYHSCKSHVALNCKILWKYDIFLTSNTLLVQFIVLLYHYAILWWSPQILCVHVTAKRNAMQTIAQWTCLHPLTIYLMLSLQWWLFKHFPITFWWQQKAVTKRQTNFFHLLRPLCEDRGIWEAKVRSKTHFWFSTAWVLFEDIYMWTCTSHAFLKAPLILSFFLEF